MLKSVEGCRSVQFTKAICIAQLTRMSHCAAATRKPVCFKFTLETRVGDVLAGVSVLGGCSRHVARQQQNSCHSMCCVCITPLPPHDLSVDERSRHWDPSQTKCMSSARYEGAWPDNDEKTKHASLKSTCLWTGSQCNWLRMLLSNFFHNR